jgi:hypothetical protein
METVKIFGRTFEVKDQIKALGGKWDPRNKAWDVPVDKADEVRALIPVKKSKDGQPLPKPSAPEVKLVTENGQRFYRTAMVQAIGIGLPGRDLVRVGVIAAGRVNVRVLSPNGATYLLPRTSLDSLDPAPDWGDHPFSG